MPLVVRPQGAAGWTVPLGFFALLGGWLAAQFAIGFLAIVFSAAGGSYKDPAFIVVASILQSVVFVMAAVAVARSRGPVTARDFGLVRAPFVKTAGKSAAIFFAYLIALAIYSQLVDLTADETPDKLGAGNGSLGMIAFVLMAAIVAPFAEEFLFRGLVFRAFANGIGVMLAALVSGLLFGALHLNSLDTDRLLQVVSLIVLGVLFALLYAWSGTLFAPIAVHATNNALAVGYYASTHDSTLGLVLALAAWTLMMVLCTAGWCWTDRANPAQPADVVV